MTDTSIQLQEFTSRAITLFSRPTVAIELMRLAEEPGVNAQSLKECIAQDPALTCKVLRVVNSSLFGLHRPVADLTQAINLLGIKPLKLLVLGFNLPDALFAEVAARELEWYWTNTLTRAVAARMIGEHLWQQAGDEAFIAGLLQDIGILVLLHELGESYAKFLTGVIGENCHLASLEQDTLGFDHIQLSAALLARWQLPEQLVRAIETPKRMNRLSRMSPPEGDLPQILHLADLLMQLVGQRRLTVLPELLEAGKLYRGMTKSKLTGLVEGLQPQVDQLAEVLSLELTAERDYVQMLVDAQRKMAVLGEELATDAASGDDAIYEELLAHTGELTEAMQTFLAGKKQRAASGDLKSQAHAAHYGQHATRGFVGRTTAEPGDRATLLHKLAAAGKTCRQRRYELSLVIVEPNTFEERGAAQLEAASLIARTALAAACNSLDPQKVTLVTFGALGGAAIVTDCERRSALALARQAISEFTNVANGSDADAELASTLCAGVATVSVVPRNFDPARVVDSATRCLSAARACGTSAVKSIEV